jgi:hypothetical protein
MKGVPAQPNAHSFKGNHFVGSDIAQVYIATNQLNKI